MFSPKEAIDLERIVIEGKEGNARKVFKVGEVDKTTKKVCTAIKVSTPTTFEPSTIGIYLNDQLYTTY